MHLFCNENVKHEYDAVSTIAFLYTASVQDDDDDDVIMTVMMIVLIILT